MVLDTTDPSTCNVWVSSKMASLGVSAFKKHQQNCFWVRLKEIRKRRGS